MGYIGNKPAQTTIPVDDSVTSVMIQDDAVTSAKIAGTTIVNADINASAAISNSKLETDPTNASNLSSGSVPLAQLGNVDTTGLENDIAILGFKVAANGSLSKYDLVDQTIDDFQDATGVDAGSSSGEFRITTGGKYYVGATNSGVATQVDYTASSTFNAPAGGVLDGTAQVLVVAGGGGGGVQGGGGGGGGGVVYHATYPITASQAYTVTIGSFGTGHDADHSPYGSNGEDTVFGTITATGGGRGGDGTANAVGDGGSGGAPGYDSNVTVVGVGTQPADTTASAAGGVGYGNDGGEAISDAGGSDYFGGGGGGGSAAGTDADASGGGNGGNGYDATAVFGTVGGASGIFSGGGGGGCHQSFAGTPGSGGTGGGVSGTKTGSGPSAATANTGGGGGGCGAGDGGDGGSGFAAIKYTPISLTYGDMTLISNATTAEAVPTKGDLVMTYTNGAGTATINTDIKGWVSRDNGVTYTQFTLADEGDTGGHTILTAHDLDISAQPSGSAMRYKITTHNQSAAKETRIQAVSLGWS